MKHPHTSLSYSPLNVWPFSAHFLTLSDLPILPLFHPIFSFSSRCFNLVMDVHKARFTSLAFFFPVISPVNSLPAPVSQRRVTGPGSLCGFYTLAPSARCTTVVTKRDKNTQHVQKHIHTHSLF